MDSEPKPADLDGVLSSASDEAHKAWAQRPWDPAAEPVTAPRPDNPGAEDHAWELFGSKADYTTPTTYFWWGCRQCGRRVVTETPSKDAHFMADQCPPDESALRRGNVDPDCRQALVDGVSRL